MNIDITKPELYQLADGTKVSRITGCIATEIHVDFETVPSAAAAKGSYYKGYIFSYQGLHLGTAGNGYLGNLELRQPQISLDKKYTNGYGDEIILYAVDAPGERPIIGVRICAPDNWVITTWHPGGRYLQHRTSADLDLIEVIPETVTYRNVYTDSATGQEHATLVECQRGHLSDPAWVCTLKTTRRGDKIMDVTVEEFAG